jgi:hypothetical protein
MISEKCVFALPIHLDLAAAQYHKVTLDGVELDCPRYRQGCQNAHLRRTRFFVKTLIN